MTPDYDAIVIGAGHNGLVTACKLSKAGLNVLVVERRDITGGAAATEEVFPGFRYNTGAHDAGLFREELIDELNLYNHGLKLINSDVAAFAPLGNGESITVWQDPLKTTQEIARFSKKDSEKYSSFVSAAGKYSKWLSELIALTPPDVFNPSGADMMSWANMALKTKRLGNKDMMELLRVLPMTVKEFLDEWFESEALKGVLGTPGVTGSMQGPQASGTALMFLYQKIGSPNGGFKSSRIVQGGIGQLSSALASSAKESGAEIVCGEGISKILLDGNRAVGIELVSGKQISTRIVASSAGPRHTLFGLVGAAKLEPRVMRRVRNIKFRGTTAKVNLALSELPHFQSDTKGTERLTGHIIICPSLDYLERAYDDAKYGRISKEPYLDIVIPSILDDSMAPPGKHVVSINMQYAPYHLKDGEWEIQREALGDRVIQTLAHHIPNINDTILHRQIITPLDLERDYGLTEGSIFHGQMGLDQLLFMRPIPGYGQYQSPVENLYFCGAGAPPGGGVSGTPGSNAASQILRNWKNLSRGN
jgi:phytoene dehydrogenase-like protein